jgi:hypothetical protein
LVVVVVVEEEEEEEEEEKEEEAVPAVAQVQAPVVEGTTGTTTCPLHPPLGANTAVVVTWSKFCEDALELKSTWYCEHDCECVGIVDGNPTCECQTCAWTPALIGAFGVAIFLIASVCVCCLYRCRGSCKNKNVKNGNQQLPMEPFHNSRSAMAKSRFNECAQAPHFPCYSNTEVRNQPPPMPVSATSHRSSVKDKAPVAKFTPNTVSL